MFRLLGLTLLLSVMSSVPGFSQTNDAGETTLYVGVDLSCDTPDEIRMVSAKYQAIQEKESGASLRGFQKAIQETNEELNQETACGLIDMIYEMPNEAEKPEQRVSIAGMLYSIRKIIVRGVRHGKNYSPYDVLQYTIIRLGVISKN